MLFELLMTEGYDKTLQSESYWMNTLPEVYHCFGGMPHDFEVCGAVVKLKLAPPITGTGTKVCSSARCF